MPGMITTERGTGPSPKSNIVVLGGGVSQEIFLEVLFRRYGKSAIVDIDPDAPCRRWASRFYNVSIYDYEKCRDAIADIVTEDTSIITFATGRAGDVCYRLCEHFGLPRRSRSLISASINKRFLSERLRFHGLAVPCELFLEPSRFDSAELAEMSFPAILKPVDGGGGANVRRVASPGELVELRHQFNPGSQMMLQEELTGCEKVVYILVRNGKIATLLHGENLFDRSTGWNWPLGLALEHVATSGPLPRWLARLSTKLVTVFDLWNDFIVVELIRTDLGDYIIDVEINALTAFACSKVMDGNRLTGMLVDTYLNRDAIPPDATPWVSCLTFFGSGDSEHLRRLRKPACENPSFHMELPTVIARLESFGTVAYKGGYVIIKDATDVNDAATRSQRIVREMLEG